MASSKAARIGEEWGVLFVMGESKADANQGVEVRPLSSVSQIGAEYVRRTRVDKVNAELVTLTYGTMVAQLCSDFESNYTEVNKQLDRMGYNIGMRLVEDFFAKSGTQRCANLKDTAETISKIGFKMFLNVTPTVTNWTADNKQFSLVFEDNPLADFVELPDDGRAQDELWYSNIFCGVIKGALEMVQMQVDAIFVSDVLRGNDTTEMRITLLRYLDDEMPPNDE
ncbi:uncharacterized protein KY384_001511 [Bacidia gigantensis]|uniref:uncharacterized protein n=1 Tax=Bacidia gigantensis TaxID=2732470 RepID=UPI001D037167|nr:uncharacterized protein KY384_001511 [Bacidia gigantensis]KAG8533770.1 hypothetical protein KY384_001511 [Bacidia gigantensis]